MCHITEIVLTTIRVFDMYVVYRPI